MVPTLGYHRDCALAWPGFSTRCEHSFCRWQPACAFLALLLQYKAYHDTSGCLAVYTSSCRQNFVGDDDDLFWSPPELGLARIGEYWRPLATTGDGEVDSRAVRCITRQRISREGSSSRVLKDLLAPFLEARVTEIV